MAYTVYFLVTYAQRETHNEVTREKEKIKRTGSKEGWN